MKGRLLLTSVLLAMVTVVPTWLSLQPLLGRRMALSLLGPSLGVLTIDFVLALLLIYLLLRSTIGRPVERIETTVRELARGDEESGGLLLRLDRALRRLVLDLGEERRLNQSRLNELTASHAALVRLQAEFVANDRLATVGRLAAGIAHEVGNPLSGILGYLSVIRMQQPGNPELIELIARIEQEVQRIDSIVRGLLELGRPSRGKAQPVDVRPIIEASVRLLGANRDFEGVRVEVEAPPTLWLVAEPGPLSQVLVNLLLNAAQAMEGRGRIVVRGEQTDAGGRVIVEDEGPGLSQQVKARLFEPFFTTKAAGKGTGLGLAISRHLLSQFGGRLDADERPGGGARFIIALPTP